MLDKPKVFAWIDKSEYFKRIYFRVENAEGETVARVYSIKGGRFRWEVLARSVVKTGYYEPFRPFGSNSKSGIARTVADGIKYAERYLQVRYKIFAAKVLVMK